MKDGILHHGANEETALTIWQKVDVLSRKLGAGIMVDRTGIGD
jgi:hypothetical protein